MVFPRTGLPNAVSLRRRVPVGLDSDDNTIYRFVPVLARPARYYRDQTRELADAHDSVVVEGMVTFHAEPSDNLNLIPVDSEIDVSGGQYGDGKMFQVINPTLQMLWARPSHWEISIGRTKQ